MTRHKLPWVFRIAASLILTTVMFGAWWQRQAVGATGRAFLAAVATGCPAALPTGHQPNVADTAHALDRWGYAQLGNLIVHDGHDRCARGVAR